MNLSFKPALMSIAILLSCGSTTALASDTSPQVRQEIQSLLLRLKDSGCQFNRNGTWYSAAQARDHLIHKLDYLDSKGTLKNAEQFIELAASSSSYSGRPYQVKCSQSVALESRVWLNRELAVIRNAE